MHTKGIGIYIVSRIAEDVIVLLNEDFPRMFYALTVLLRLGGRATPARIKAFLREEKLMSYRTFLKAVNDLELYDIVHKEYGEYVIKQEYVNSIRYFIEEVPALLAKLIDRLGNNEISTDEALLENGRLLEELSIRGASILLQYDSLSIIILENLYLFALYLTDRVRRLIKIKEEIDWLEIEKETQGRIVSPLITIKTRKT